MPIKINKFETKFYELNVKRKINLCCKGECFNNYISDDDTLICGLCEKEKHIDNFLTSSKGYLCELCDVLEKVDFKEESRKFLKGVDKLLSSFE